jgi:hypothetical protein
MDQHVDLAAGVLGDRSTRREADEIGVEVSVFEVEFPGDP